jgi:hypothetical protein
MSILTYCGGIVQSGKAERLFCAASFQPSGGGLFPVQQESVSMYFHRQRTAASGAVYGRHCSSKKDFLCGCTAVSVVPFMLPLFFCNPVI